MICLRGLTKVYGGRQAVAGLDLTISEGEIFGLLGPNGAGKTTLIKMLTMLTKPAAGSIIIGGKDIFTCAKEVKAMVAAVPQHINLDPDLTIEQNLHLHGCLYHMSRQYRERRISELLDYVDLSGRRQDFVQSLSGGMKRRLLIARALMHEPKVLLLDEPTVALDPQVRRKLWDLIRRMKQDDITVVLTTHYIEEAENLCDRVAVLDHGSLIALDRPRDLCRKVGDYVVEWENSSSREYKFFASREEAAAFAGTLHTTTIIRSSNLEDVFIELTGRKVNG